MLMRPGYILTRGLTASAIIASLMTVKTSQAQVTRVLGLDVSAWQTDITTTEWATLKRPTNQQVGGVFGDGRDFVFIRSSRGGTTGYYNQNDSDNSDGLNTLSQRYDDPYFVQNMTRATNAGLFAGAYHFSRPDVIASTTNSGGIANTGADEADHFMQMAGPWMRPGYLLPVHDLEAGDGLRSDNEMAQFTIDFSNRVYDVMGIRPAIYTNGNYAAFVIGGASAALRTEVVNKHPVLWTARWPNQTDPTAIDVQNAQPKDSYSQIYGPWDDAGVTHPWSFWQYASTMKLNGNNNKTANTDVNVANGGLEFLKDNLVPALWTNDNSGDWSTLANWNSGQTPIAPVQGPGQVARVGSLTLPTPRLPGAAGSGVTSGQHDTVILDRPNASITVTLATGSYNIRKLYARETLNFTGGTLAINYVPSADSTPISAQFSAAVTLGNANLSVHTLQVDATRTFTIDGGHLTANKINLMPHASTPAKLLLGGDLDFTPLADAAAVIGNGSGAGLAGRVDLGGANRTLNVADGAAAVDLTISVPVLNGGLVKAGAGALALTGANAYAGDTAVEQGSLALGTPFLANGADVKLLTGATLGLNFAGTDVIDSLFIDGVSQAAGVWGALGSGAEFTSPLFTGTGMLQVTTFVAPPSPADFNLDGFVDADDLLVWQTNLGMAGDATLADGDANGDLHVDGNDLLIWQAEYTGPAPVTSTVPEPSGWALLLVMAATLPALRRLPKQPAW